MIEGGGECIQVLGSEVEPSEEFRGIKSKIVGRCNIMGLELNIKVTLSWGLAIVCR